MRFSLNKKMAIIIFVAFFFASVDRFLKILAWRGNININILGNWLSFSFTKNYNIAFSLPLGGFFLNIVIVFIILVLIYVWLRQVKKKDVLLAYPLTFIIFGAISNLLDRFLYGYVIDYISIKYFTVFNVADAMITGSVVAFLLFQIKKEKEG